MEQNNLPKYGSIYKNPAINESPVINFRVAVLFKEENLVMMLYPLCIKTSIQQK